MKAYKVFRIQNNELTSISTYFMEKKYFVYSKNKKNHRIVGCGPYCAFDKLEDAEKFKEEMINDEKSINLKIFEVEGTKSEDVCVYTSNPCTLKIENILFLPKGIMLLLDDFTIVKEVIKC